MATLIDPARAALEDILSELQEIRRVLVAYKNETAGLDGVLKLVGLKVTCATCNSELLYKKKKAFDFDAESVRGRVPVSLQIICKVCGERVTVAYRMEPDGRWGWVNENRERREGE